MFNSVFIIAEAGVNHNGSIAVAKKLIDVAVDARVDAIKFQTFKASNLVLKNAPQAPYQIKNVKNSYDTQFEMLKNLELDISSHIELIKYCKDKKIIFLSSPFDLESVDELIQLNLNFFKIPSGEIDNIPYLRKIGEKNKNIILSTGISNLSDIERALDVLISAGTCKDNITVLHCNTEYPTPMIDVNLKAMLTIKDAFKVAVGYSDHTLGIEIPIAAVAMGACVIEKHFTLSKTMEGPDHRASLDPDELRAMVYAIRNIEMALGDGIKKISDSEKNNKFFVRKSIVAKTRIKKGDVFSQSNLTVKRPGRGMSPAMWDAILGQIAHKEYQENDLI